MIVGAIWVRLCISIIADLMEFHIKHSLQFTRNAMKKKHSASSSSFERHSLLMSGYGRMAKTGLN